MDRGTITEFYDRHWPRREDEIELRMRMEAEEAAFAGLAPLEGQWVLDIGAGAGGPAGRLISGGAVVVAVDISGAGLQLLIDEHQGSGRCFAVRADAHALPFRRGVFDRVAVFSVLMFFRLDEALPEFARVLGSTGKFVALEPLVSNPFMYVYRKLTRFYTRIARWHTAKAIRESLQRTFCEVTYQGFYLFPPAALLPRGALRRVLYRAGKSAASLPFIRELTWLSVWGGRGRTY